MSRRVILLIIAGVIAAFTAISVKNRLSEAPPEKPVVVTANRVVIAKHDLSPGNFIQAAQDLDWGPAPAPNVSAKAAPPQPGEAPAPEENTAIDTYLHENAVHLTDFNGAVVRHLIHTGDAVPADALMKSGEGGFMSAVLNPGMRAVSIAVNATSGNAGFVSPGDHLDLIVTHHLKTSGNNSNDESVVSETFARNVRVVAVDQMLDNPDNKAVVAKTLTVEVTSRQAEEVAVAAAMGSISVALRSLAEPKHARSGKANALTDLYGEDNTDYTSDADLMQKNAIVPHVQVIRGDKSEMIEFYRDTQ
jgi:pilus assembly protein CpaB